MSWCLSAQQGSFLTEYFNTFVIAQIIGSSSMASRLTIPIENTLSFFMYRFQGARHFNYFDRNSNAERRLGRNINYQAFKISRLDHMLQPRLTPSAFCNSSEELCAIQKRQRTPFRISPGSPRSSSTFMAHTTFILVVDNYNYKVRIKQV